ncbi:MAG: 3-hydroxyacyl-CoA dehydrogenase NAD-binding domain-containing protein [Burkholderiaceae bacterium]
MNLFDLTDADRQRAAEHIAFAEREAATIDDLPAGVTPRPVNSVAIIGAGTMGGGIALSLAAANIPSTLIETGDEALQRGLARVRKTLEASVKRGSLDADQMQARLALIGGSLSLEDAAADVDLIIEAVFEDMALKKQIFTRLDGIARAGTVLATNTSGLDIDEIAAVTGRPAEVIGAHFFSPANVMRLLEVVRTRDSAPDVIATLMALGPRIGKTAVLARVYPGFVGNAMFRQYHREAHFLVEDGALPHEVDAALTAFGYRMGIFAVHDLAGNDVGYSVRKAQMATRDNDRRWNDLIIELVDMGRLGQKSGRGWYRYDDGDRRPQRDPDLETIIIERSARMGITRRPIDADEILQRCLFGMVNEGARLLERGIAQRPSDIDIVFLRGYGFPPEQGGPMFMADRIGLGRVAATVRRLHDAHGAWWEPAPLLLQLAAEERSFADWQRNRR